jgi:hypothetical protein
VKVERFLLHDAIHHVRNSRHFVSLVIEEGEIPEKVFGYLLRSESYCKYIYKQFIIDELFSFFLFLFNLIFVGFPPLFDDSNKNGGDFHFVKEKSIKESNDSNIYNKKTIRAVVYHQFSFTIQFPVVRLLTEFQ